MVSAQVEIPYFFTLYLRLAELEKNRNIKRSDTKIIKLMFNYKRYAPSIKTLEKAFLLMELYIIVA